MPLRSQCYVISELNGALPVIIFKWCHFTWANSLVTAVPVPLIPRLDRKEVAGALVLHFLGEPQEDPEVNVSHSGSIGWPWMDHIRHWHEMCWKALLAVLSIGFSERSAKGLFLCAQCFWENQPRTFMSWQGIMLEKCHSTLIHITVFVNLSTEPLSCHFEKLNVT